MHLWHLPSFAPVLLGYYRLSESVTLTFDFMLFEIFMCAILYLVTRGILVMKVVKLERAKEEAYNFFNHLSKEPNSLLQSECLYRCLNMSDAALNEYDSLLLYFGNLLHEPSRKVCLRRWPNDFQLMKKTSTQESLQCLKNAPRTFSENNLGDLGRGTNEYHHFLG